VTAKVHKCQKSLLNESEISYVTFRSLLNDDIRRLVNDKSAIKFRTLRVLDAMIRPQRLIKAMTNDDKVVGKLKKFFSRLNFISMKIHSNLT
jgi:hypothetical protein